MHLKIHGICGIIASVAGVCALAVAQDDNGKIQSPAANAAIKKHETGASLARKSYLQALIKLDQQEIVELEAALQVSMRKGAAGFDDAKRIEAAKKAAQEALDAHQAEFKSGNAAAPQAGFTPTGSAIVDAQGEVVMNRGRAPAGLSSKGTFKPPLKVTAELYFPAPDAYEINISVLNRTDKNRVFIQVQKGQGFSSGASVSIFGKSINIEDKLPLIKAKQLYVFTCAIDKDRVVTVDIDGKVLATGAIPADVDAEGPITIIGGVVSSVVYKRVSVIE